MAKDGYILLDYGDDKTNYKYSHEHDKRMGKLNTLSPYSA